jgi:hypothetical protein
MSVLSHNFLTNIKDNNMKKFNKHYYLTLVGSTNSKISWKDLLGNILSQQLLVGGLLFSVQAAF